MRNNYILDAGFLNILLGKDPRLRGMLDGVDRGDDSAFISSPNLAEFYYKTCRNLGREVAELYYYQFSRRAEIVDDPELSRAAGLEKCRRQLDLSLADCYALALTRRLKGILLTTDGVLGEVKDVDVKYFNIKPSKS